MAEKMDPKEARKQALAAAAAEAALVKAAQLAAREANTEAVATTKNTGGKEDIQGGSDRRPNARGQRRRGRDHRGRGRGRQDEDRPQGKRDETSQKGVPPALPTAAIPASPQPQVERTQKQIVGNLSALLNKTLNATPSGQQMGSGKDYDEVQYPAGLDILPSPSVKEVFSSFPKADTTVEFKPPLNAAKGEAKDEKEKVEEGFEGMQIGETRYYRGTEGEYRVKRISDEKYQVKQEGKRSTGEWYEQRVNARAEKDHWEQISAPEPNSQEEYYIGPGTDPQTGEPIRIFYAVRKLSTSEGFQVQGPGEKIELFDDQTALNKRMQEEGWVKSQVKSTHVVDEDRKEPIGSKKESKSFDFATMLPGEVYEQPIPPDMVGTLTPSKVRKIDAVWADFTDNQGQRRVKGKEIVLTDSGSFYVEGKKVVAEKPSPPLEKGALEAEIAKLRKAVDVARQEFVQRDYENTQSKNWFKKRFSNPFGKKEKLGSDKDVYALKDEYYAKLNALQAAELKKIKHFSQTDQEQKDELVGIVRFYKFDEVLNLYKDYTQVRTEKASWGVKLVEGVGAWYNRQPLEAKLAFMGVCWLGAAATGGATLWLRKFLAAAGAFVGTEALIEKWDQDATKKIAEAEAKKEVAAILSENKGERLKLLEQNLAGSTARLDERLQKRKKEALFNKGVAAALAVGAGSAAWAYEQFSAGHSVVTPSAEAFPRVVPPLEAGGTAPTVPERPIIDLVPPEAEQGPDIPSEKPGTGNLVTPEASLTPLEVSQGKLLTDYPLTSADGRRGLWGVLESRLPPELPTEEKNRMIASLEKIIQDKLQGMTPEQLKNVGFPEGDIDKIYAGTTLKFSELFSMEEVQSALGNGEINPSPESGGVVPNTDLADSEQSSAAPEDPDQRTAEIRVDQASMLGKTYDIKAYTEFFRVHPETLEEYRETGARYFRFIMQGNQENLNSFGNKTFTTLGISAGTLENLQDNDSLKRLGLFVGEARRTFGALGMPSPKEKVYEYIARVTMMGIEDAKHPTLRLPQTI